MTTGLDQPLQELDIAMRAVLNRVRADAAGTELVVELRVDPDSRCQAVSTTGRPLDRWWA